MTATSALRGAGRVAALFREERILVARFFATALGRAAAQMATLLLIQHLFAGLTGARSGAVGRLFSLAGPGGALGVAAAVLFGAQLAQSAFTHRNAVAQLQVSRVVELGMTRALLAHLLAESVPFFDRQSHGDLVETVRHDVTRVRLTVRALGMMMVEAVILAALAAAAIALAPRLALLCVAVIPAAAIPILLGARRALRRSFEARRGGYALSDIVLQVARGIRVIKACRAERAELSRADAALRHNLDRAAGDLRARALGAVTLDFVAGFAMVAVVLLGGREVLDGRLGWPALVAFVMAVRAMLGPIHNLHTHGLEVAAMGASVARIDAVLSRAPEVRDLPGAPPLAAPPRRISFEKVSFAHEGAPVLHDLSFTVEAGETIGVVGPSGSGKSTLLSLLARYYDPTEGRIAFDDRDLRSVPLADLYSTLAVVPQDTFLFAASVGENIRAGRPEAGAGEVESAARAAAIHEEIAALSEGYDTRVGMGGRDLSGGQRQRVGIARALLAGAPILLLDEATSSLDSLAEAAVQAAVEQSHGGQTRFIAAHRLSTLRRADRILVLDSGRIVGFGPHAELVGSCPVYRSLWEAQRLDHRAEAA